MKLLTRGRPLRTSTTSEFCGSMAPVLTVATSHETTVGGKHGTGTDGGGDRAAFPLQRNGGAVGIAPRWASPPGTDVRTSRAATTGNNQAIGFAEHTIGSEAKTAGGGHLLDSAEGDETNREIRPRSDRAAKDAKGCEGIEFIHTIAAVPPSKTRISMSRGGVTTRDRGVLRRRSPLHLRRVSAG